jgi:hypothetical protein
MIAIYLSFSVFKRFRCSPKGVKVLSTGTGLASADGNLVSAMPNTATLRRGLAGIRI